MERHFGDLDAGDRVIEPACGPGSFLQAVPSHVMAVGVEIDPAMARAARANTGREVLTGDFLTMDIDFQPTAIIGNPPFNLKLIDGFLDRAHKILPEGGRVGFILPCYAFQTAGRVAEYAESWSMFQELLPRNIYHGLSLPLLFAMFSKDRRRTMVGFALYREAADVLGLPQPYRDVMNASSGPVWMSVVEEALRRMGGEAEVGGLYAEIEGRRPTKTKFWREKIRQTLRRYADRFELVGPGRYRLQSYLGEAA
jgi:site-specific DNA-methyltransferase (adenine-specific)